GRTPGAEWREDRRAGSTVACLVQAKRARSAVAAHTRSLRHLDFRNHAPANAGQDGHSLLATLDARTADRAIAGSRSKRKSAEALGRTRLLHARQKFAEGRENDRGSARRPFSGKIR